MEENTVAPQQSLGVGAIVSESFSLLFRNLIPVAIMSFIPIVLGLLVSGMIVGMPVALGVAEPNFLGGSAVILGFLASFFIQIATYGIIIAALVQLAYDAKIRRPLSYKKYAKAALATIFPNIVTLIIVSILAGIGFLLFVIPGIWIYGVYCVVVPAIVLERAGFGALRRSQALTKGYRWPVIGAFFLIFLCSMLITMAATFVVTMIISSMASVGLVVAVLLQGVLFSITYGLMSIAVALIYARLREIKEGVSVDDLVAVFE